MNGTDSYKDRHVMFKFDCIGSRGAARRFQREQSLRVICTGLVLGLTKLCLPCFVAFSPPSAFNLAGMIHLKRDIHMTRDGARHKRRPSGTWGGRKMTRAASGPMGYRELSMDSRFCTAVTPGVPFAMLPASAIW